MKYIIFINRDYFRNINSFIFYFLRKSCLIQILEFNMWLGIFLFYSEIVLRKNLLISLYIFFQLVYDNLLNNNSSILSYLTGIEILKFKLDRSIVIYSYIY